jgi:hypothetical protein
VLAATIDPPWRSLLACCFCAVVLPGADSSMSFPAVFPLPPFPMLAIIRTDMVIVSLLYLSALLLLLLRFSFHKIRVPSLPSRRSTYYTVVRFPQNLPLFFLIL